MFAVNLGGLEMEIVRLALLGMMLFASIPAVAQRWAVASTDAARQSIPAAISSPRVSNKGRPTTPEWLPARNRTNASARPWMA